MKGSHKCLLTINLLVEVRKKGGKASKFLVSILPLFYVFASLDTIIKSPGQILFIKKRQTTIDTLKFKLGKIKFNAGENMFFLRLETS